MTAGIDLLGTAVAGLGWSSDLVVLDGHAPAAEALRAVEASSAGWAVIVRYGGSALYAWSRAELLARLTAPGARLKGPLDEFLGLHEYEASQPVRGSADVQPIDRPGTRAPSALRYVEVDAGGQPRAVGGADVPALAASQRRMRGRTRGRSPAAAAEPPPAAGAEHEPLAAAPHTGPQEDEGTTPVRHPSIESAAPLVAGKPVTLVIDLRREASPETAGGPLSLGEQAANWETLDIGVTLVSAGIGFADGGTGTVTIRRNQDSVAAEVKGRVRPGLAPDAELDVHAQFWLGTRCSGSATRRFVVAAAAAAPPPTAPAAPIGAMSADPAAAKPDLTVYITLFDPEAPGRMHWRLVTETFDALPAKLDGIINLGRDPRQEAVALFKDFAGLERGKHRRRIEGFGERLWKRSPQVFKDAYWALVDHYQRPLTIQFTSDDPHLPWELMRPSRPGEVQPPLALQHAVARWIGSYQGWLRNQLPTGAMVVIAPRYSSLSTRLSLAEETAKRLLDDYHATPVPGTRDDLLALLEHPPAGPVALLYFTGHGLFDAESAAASAIKLEHGEQLAADEVDRQEVMLGERDGTVVFFNACEVGATAGAIGEVGGWANAFLSRRFRAFIAPLWAIDEEDASLATKTLVSRIVADRQPIGAALRDLRKEFGEVSPTFYSYLLYGDVTARFGA